MLHFCFQILIASIMCGYSKEDWTELAKMAEVCIGRIVTKQKNNLEHIITVNIARLRIPSGKKQTSGFLMNGWVVESSETQLQLEVRLKECWSARSLLWVRKS